MKVLAISAHPDDETLGFGGTLLKHRAAGDELYWLILTKAFSPKWSRKVIRAKEKEVEAVADAYGMKKCYWPGLPSTRLDALELNELIAPVKEALAEVGPDVVYTVHGGDINTDHGQVFKAVTVVLKPFEMARYSVSRLLSAECISSTDAAAPFQGAVFQPNCFKDITPHIEAKLAIMELYRSEIRPGFHPRSLEAIRAHARYRGAGIGVGYAEAFMLIRSVE